MKLIWIFSHAESEKVALHFCKHVREFEAENLILSEQTEISLVNVDSSQCLVVLSCEENKTVELYEKALKPQKKLTAELWKNFKEQNELTETLVLKELLQ